MVLLILIVFGLILGSFVNALVWRLHEQEELAFQISELKEKYNKPGKSGKGRKRKTDTSAIEALEAEMHTLSMAKGRSMCSKCRHPLAPKDLVPLFSWLALRGKCRYCRRPIIDPPLVELVLPLLFVLSYVFWPLPLTGYGLVSFGFWLIFLTGFIALALYDIRWYILPDKIIWPLVGLAAVQVIVHAAVFGGGMPVIVAALWGVAIGSGVFYVLHTVAGKLKREWIGFGDVKLGIVLGLLVGGPFEAILLLYIASLCGLAVSLPLLVRRRLARGSLIPYGPFLMLACVILVLAGPAITAWFDKLLLISV